MGEMTLRDKHESEVRRAVDVLAKREYLGRKRWDYDEIEGKAVACDYGAPPIWVGGFVAIAVAEKLERDAAPPADAKPLPYSRDQLGRFVREAWVRWARSQPSPKPSWLTPFDELAEADKEADRQIGESVARWTMLGMDCFGAFAAPPADAGEGDKPFVARLDVAIGTARHAIERRCPDRVSIPELRALLAAAERGGGPGPATREVMRLLAFYMDGHGSQQNGEVRLYPRHRAAIRAALHECGKEAPR